MSFTEPPGDRPPIDLAHITPEWAAAAFKKLPPGEVVATVAKLRKLAAQANSQRALLDTAMEVLRVVLKVAVV